jgi:hypothetical protein
VRYVDHPVNRGAVWNFNYVLQQARGKYFMWAAHDDYWHPHCLRLHARALDRDPDAVLVFGRTQPVGSDGRPAGPPYAGLANDASSARERFRRVLSQWELHGAIYGLYRTAALQATRPLQSILSCEIVLMAEIALAGKTIELQEQEECTQRRVPDPGASYRGPDEQLQYLDPRRKKRAQFARLRVAQEVAKSLAHSRLPPTLWAELTWDVAQIYARRQLTVDVMEAAEASLAQYPSLLTRLRAVKRASTTLARAVASTAGLTPTRNR